MLTKSVIEKFTKKLEAIPNTLGDLPKSFDISFDLSGAENLSQNSSRDLPHLSQFQNESEESMGHHTEEQQKLLKQGNIKEYSQILIEDSIEKQEDRQLGGEQPNGQDNNKANNQYIAGISDEQNGQIVPQEKEEISKDTFLKKIKQLINSENKHNPCNELKVEIPQISNDGKHLSEKYRRQFTFNLIDAIENRSCLEVNQIIKKSAKKINVYPFQVKLWIAAYRIIKDVENYENQCKNSDEPIKNSKRIQIMENAVVDYLKKNADEKRYRVIKIINQVFDVLGIIGLKSNAWLRQLIDEHQNELLGLNFESYGLVNHDQESQGSLNGNPNKANGNAYTNKAHKDKKATLKNRVDSSDEEFEEQAVSKKRKLKKNGDVIPFGDQFIPESSIDHDNEDVQSCHEKDKKTKPLRDKKAAIAKKINQKQGRKKKESEQVKAFPEFFKKTVSEKLDDAMAACIESLLKEKSEEMCMNYSVLKEIYLIYGDLFTLKKDNFERKSAPKIQPKSNDKPNKVMKLKSTTKEKLPTENRIEKAIRGDVKGNIPQKVLFMPQQKSQGLTDEKQLEMLERHLSQYIHKNPKYHIKNVEKQSDIFMETKRFSERLKHIVRTKWFAYFIKKHNVRIPQTKASPSPKHFRQPNNL